MNWNWQHKDWPDFRFDLAQTASLEAQFLLQSGHMLGVSGHLSVDDRNQIRIELLSDEALLTSRIEGEILDRDSLQSSIQKQLGLKNDSRKVSAAEEGISELLIDAYQNFDQPFTRDRMLAWHSALMKGRRDIDVGKFRSGGDPMRVVSGPIHDPIVHFEAPPAAQVPKEIERFFDWWEGPGSKLPCLAGSSVAHIFFESIHPFEDGNGRIGRALSELLVSQAIGQPIILALSQVIESNRRAYYDGLAAASRSLDIGQWVAYFSKAIVDAQELSFRSVQFLISKTRFFERFGPKLNPRQEKVILRIFREGIGGFKGGLSASNYQAIAKAPSATTTRDLAALVKMGALRREGERKHTRYHLILPPSGE